MAGEIGEAFVRIRPETSSFRGETTQAVRKDLQSTEREFGRFGRGALYGSGALRGFGRAALYASSTLIGGYGLTFALKKVTEAAKDHQVTQGQLVAAVRASGLQYVQYRGDIEKAIKAQENLGFSEEESTRGFIALLRATGSVAKATRDQAIAADIARGTNRSYLQVAVAVSRAEGGRLGTLTRLVPTIKAGVTAQQALTQASATYANAAEKYAGTAAGSQDRLNVAIHGTEVAIGTALLPTIRKYSTELANWLNKSDNQKRIQRDVNRAVEDGTKIIHGLVGAEKLIAPPIHTAVSALGGLERAVETVFIAGVVLKARRAAASFGLIRAASAQARTQVVADAAAEDAALTGVGAQAVRTSALVGRIGAYGVGGALPKGAPISQAGLIRRYGSKLAGPALLAGLLGSSQLKGGAASNLQTASTLGLLGYTVGGAPGAAIAAGGYETSQAAKALSGELGKLGVSFIGDHGASQADIVSLSQRAAAGTLTQGELSKMKVFLPGKVYSALSKIIGIAQKAIAAQRYSSPFGPVGGASRGGPTDATRAHLTPAQRRGINLAQNPEDVSAITAQRNFDLRTLATLRKRFAAGRLTTAQYTTQYTAFASDEVSQQQHLDQIAQAAADKTRAAAEKTRAAAARRAAAEKARERAAAAAEARSFRTGIAVARHQIAEVVARRSAAAKAKAVGLTIQEGALTLARQAADLAVTRAGSNQKLLDKATKLEEKADDRLIAFYKKRVAATSGLARQAAQQSLLAAQIDRASLAKQKAASGFTLAELYREAESEFKTYGSNYGAKGTPLSPQDARGGYSSTVLRAKGSVHVTQIFMGQTGPSQAMNDARAGARYLN